jgi:hypothetical protein
MTAAQQRIRNQQAIEAGLKRFKRFISSRCLRANESGSANKTPHYIYSKNPNAI